MLIRRGFWKRLGYFCTIHWLPVSKLFAAVALVTYNHDWYSVLNHGSVVMTLLWSKVEFTQSTLVVSWVIEIGAGGQLIDTIIQADIHRA